jgi:hypothetical protein
MVVRICRTFLQLRFRTPRTPSCFLKLLPSLGTSPRGEDSAARASSLRLIWCHLLLGGQYRVYIERNGVYKQINVNRSATFASLNLQVKRTICNTSGITKDSENFRACLSSNLQGLPFFQYAPIISRSIRHQKLSPTTPLSHIIQSQISQEHRHILNS